MSASLRAALLCLALVLSACAGDEGSGDAELEVVEPEDGATVSSPVEVEAEVEEFEIEPAGEVREGAGHLHIVVDDGCVPAGEVVPDDDTHVHLGDGSTSTELDLEPGEHTLCVQLADGAHSALDISQEVTITVE